MLALVAIVATLSSCSTTTVTVQPVDYRIEYNSYEYQFNHVDTIELK